MNYHQFCSIFEFYFPKNELSSVCLYFQDRFSRSYFDPCFIVHGMTSIKMQKLLNIAFSCLEPNECYLEIGTYNGKTLISALLNNIERKAYACDNFSEFKEANSLEMLERNLELYGLKDKVKFYNENFINILNHEKIELPVGVYFYDGAHDENNQYNAIKKVEYLLADKAIVIVDDWRFSQDSQSYAKSGTERAINESSHKWEMLYELPARFNGDHAMWWNGVGVFSFTRQ